MCCCSVSLWTAERLTIQSSPSTSASAYLPWGSTQTLVAPNIVSGRRVPATRNFLLTVGWSYAAGSSTSNLRRLNSSGETPSPSILSWSPVGLWSWGHQTTGWVPWTT